MGHSSISPTTAGTILTPGYSTLVEKPELDEPLMHATKDSQANTWYAMKNRTV
jgi:hypothetical protein